MADTVVVELKPVVSEDLPQLFRWINDREQVTLNAAYKPVSDLEHRAWFEAMQRRTDAFLFAIRLGDPARLIGTCQLHSINWVARSAELQIRIGELDARGHGYGTEAVRKLVLFGFHDLNLRRIHLHVFADNAAAQRTYEKAGFAVEGRLKDAAYVDGRYVDLMIMAILNV